MKSALATASDRTEPARLVLKHTNSRPDGEVSEVLPAMAEHMTRLNRKIHKLEKDILGWENLP